MSCLLALRFARPSFGLTGGAPPARFITHSSRLKPLHAEMNLPGGSKLGLKFKLDEKETILEVSDDSNTGGPTRNGGVSGSRAYSTSGSAATLPPEVVAYFKGKSLYDALTSPSPREIDPYVDSLMDAVGKVNVLAYTAARASYDRGLLLEDLNG